MSDPKRWLDELSEGTHPQDDLLADVLRAGRDDLPSGGGKEALIAKLGAGAAGMGASLQALVASGSAGATATSALGLKALVLGLALAAIGARAAYVQSARVHPVELAPPVASQAPGEERHPSTNMPSLPSASAEVLHAEMPQVHVQHAPMPRSAAPASELAPARVAAPEEAPPSTMGMELQVFAEARARAAAKDHTAVLKLTRDYAAAGRNTFASEMSVLRIDALLATGAVQQAKMLADAFLKAHPDGPLAEHVRSLWDDERR